MLINFISLLDGYRFCDWLRTRYVYEWVENVYTYNVKLCTKFYANKMKLFVAWFQFIHYSRMMCKLVRKWNSVETVCLYSIAALNDDNVHSTLFCWWWWWRWIASSKLIVFDDGNFAVQVQFIFRRVLFCQHSKIYLRNMF